VSGGEVERWRGVCRVSEWGGVWSGEATGRLNGPCGGQACVTRQVGTGGLGRCAATLNKQGWMHRSVGIW
jgi:hypothetical protein